MIDAAEMQAMAPLLHPHLDAGVLSARLGHRVKDDELVATLRTPQMLRRLLVGRWPATKHCLTGSTSIRASGRRETERGSRVRGCDLPRGRRRAGGWACLPGGELQRYRQPARIGRRMMHQSLPLNDFAWSSDLAYIGKNLSL
ncbi:hypothetical protein KTN05_15990 [Paracoccus sp. Z118]|uniref:hypothetical protein n=1 Tax=Paracoccus sp. Z118 TaxID=2851017 RepID=UPI001C2BBD41|nr:hypothetical protein [Paracoccus sp. Z118]MBV0893313.1 hypothetical protein [Paracoccus sp. Z118]